MKKMSKRGTSYFVHLDRRAVGRNSDGLEFLFVDDWQDQHIYLFCNTYGMVWPSIEALGGPGKDIAYEPSRLAPASLMELATANLIQHVDGVLQYFPGGRVERIYFNDDPEVPAER